MMVVSIIGLIASIAIPKMYTAQKHARARTCIATLREIDSAKQVWAMETRQAATAVAGEADLVGLGSYIKNTPICPLDKANTFATSYEVNAVDTAPACKVIPVDHYFGRTW
jgi:competence protein ComGC